MLKPSPANSRAADSRAAKSRSALFSDIYRPDAKAVRFLTVLVLFGVAFGLYRGIQDNYLADIIHISPFERGIVEFFREIPGLLVVLFLALMYRFTDSRIFKISIALMTGGTAGLLLTSSSPYFMTKFLVVLFMVLYSIGDHLLSVVRATISMDLAKREKSGASLGMTSSVNQLGQIVGFILVTGIFFFLARFGYKRADISGYRITFALSTGLMIASCLIALALKETTLKTKRRRFYFARKFHKYYMLEVFYGSRKQVFLTFAPYVLILHYGADPSIMSLLYAICAGFGMLFAPLMGKLIDRIGYKAVMVADTILLFVVCLLYGFSHRIFPSKEIAFWVVCTNFVLDSVLSMAHMAAQIYVQRISSNQEEITATLSTGVSVNHVISIFIALMGGWIWKVTGIEVLFSLSAFLALLNCIYAATIKKSEEYNAG